MIENKIPEEVVKMIEQWAESFKTGNFFTRIRIDGATYAYQTFAAPLKQEIEKRNEEIHWWRHHENYEIESLKKQLEEWKALAEAWEAYKIYNELKSQMIK
jgi:hypothetical protein